MTKHAETEMPADRMVADVVLELEEVGYIAGRKEILKGVSMKLHAGEITVVLGKNGAGKSSLVKLASGERRVSFGNIKVLGRDIREWKEQELAKCRAMVAQSSDVAFASLVEELVLLGRFPFTNGVETWKDWEIVELVMKRLEILHLWGREYSTLSGGEKQRVQLARALCQLFHPKEENAKPRLLILDEPTSSLDIEKQLTFVQLLREIKQDHVGILVVLHDLNLSRWVADTGIILKEGKLVTSGDKDTLFQPEVLQHAYDVQMQWATCEGGERYMAFLPPESTDVPDLECGGSRRFGS